MRTKAKSCNLGGKIIVTLSAKWEREKKIQATWGEKKPQPGIRRQASSLFSGLQSSNNKQKMTLLVELKISEWVLEQTLLAHQPLAKSTADQLKSGVP